MVREIDQQEVRRQGKEQDVGFGKCHSETHYLANLKIMALNSFILITMFLFL